MMKNLVALVTGGASGLGRATVERLSTQVSHVVFCDLPTSEGREVANEMSSNVTYIPADIRKVEDVQHLLKDIEQKQGRLDVLVNCAGRSNGFITYNYRKKMPRSLMDYELVLNNNVVGTLNVIRLAADLIARNKVDNGKSRGVIINTAGIEGIRGKESQVAIAAASGAIIAMTKPLADEFRDIGIRVVTIVPGMIASPLIGQIGFELISINSECMIAPNRVGAPKEYAHLVHAIISNPSMNGTTLELAAGFDWTGY